MKRVYGGMLTALLKYAGVPGKDGSNDNRADRVDLLAFPFSGPLLGTVATYALPPQAQEAWTGWASSASGPARSGTSPPPP